jgi:formyl-CoA transferase
VQPLSGVRVLEVGNLLAAPFCTRQLADLGADVIKVERPDLGDITRGTSPFIDGESSSFLGINRNKRSLALDLKAAEGRTIFLELAKVADILVENLSPGAMARLSLSYEDLRELNPRLVYVSASGWGQDGPYAELPGLDVIVQAMSGLMSITGEVDGGPVKVGVPIADLACALFGAIAALGALRQRDLTGEGQHVDVSLFESAVSLAVWEAGEYFATGNVHGRLGTVHQAFAPYQAIRAADGEFCIGVVSDANFQSLAAALDRPDLLSDARFVDNAHRFANRVELIAEIEAVTMTQPRRHWLDRCSAMGVTVGSIQDFREVFNDPHLKARGFIGEAPHATLGQRPQTASPMRMSLSPSRLDRAGPLLGEHTFEILAEIGLSDEEVEKLSSAGVIAGPVKS